MLANRQALSNIGKRVKLVYLKLNPSQEFLDFKNVYGSILFQTAFTKQVGLVIVFVCLSNAIKSFIQTSSVQIVIAQMDLLLVFAAGHYLYHTKKIKQFNLLMQLYPYFLLCGWLWETRVLHQVLGLNPSTSTMTTMLLVFGIVSFAPSYKQSVLSTILPGFMLLAIIQMLYPEIKENYSFEVYVEPIAIGVFLNVLVMAVFRYRYNSDKQNKGLTSIFDASTQALFTVSTNAQNQIDIHTERSPSTDRIFNFKDTSVKNFEHDILVHSTLGEADKRLVISTLFSSMGEDEINFEFNSHLLPTELLLKLDGRECHLALTYSPVVGGYSHCVEKILITAADVTNEKKASEERDRIRHSTSLMLEIVAASESISRSTFVHLIQSAALSLTTLLDDIKKTPAGISIVRQAFIAAHTIKGQSAGLSKIRECAHEVESLFVTLRDKQAMDFSEHDKGIVEDGIEKLLLQVNLYRDVLESQLNWIHGSDIEVSVDAKLIEKLLFSDKSHTLQLIGQEDVHGLSQLLSQYCPDVRGLISDAIKNAKRCAEKLSKPLPSVNYEGLSLRLLPQGNFIVRDILPHIINNSLDHGIEDSSVREAIGKKAEGTLNFAFSRTANGDSMLRYSDDGAGLNIKALRKKIAESGMMMPKLDRDVANTILESGFSTKNEVTEISGRGVGLYAVAEKIRRVGGFCSIEIQNESEGSSFRPFELIIIIPKSIVFISSESEESMVLAAS